MARPISTPQITPYCGAMSTVDGGADVPSTVLILGPTRSIIKNDIQIQSSISPQSTGQTDRQTDRKSINENDSYDVGLRVER